MIISELLSLGSQKLKEGQINSYILDSEIILSHVLKRRETMLLSTEMKVSNKEIDDFNNFIKRRLKSEPIAYLFNKKNFGVKILL